MKNDINPIVLESLIKKIASKYCSESDQNNFEMTGNIQIEQALKGQFVREKSGVLDSDPFGIGEVKIVVEIAALIGGTVKALWEIKKLRNASVASDDFKEKVELWKEKLISEGISPQKANSIIGEFQNDMKSLFS